MLPSINGIHKKSLMTRAFKGINFSEARKDGDLIDGYGLTTTDYPCISQRPGRTKITGFVSPTDIFEWDGALWVVDQGVLYHYKNGVKTAIYNVTDTRKQFAVINTKLVVWPDKIYIDLTNNEYHPLSVSLTTSGEAGSCTMTDSSITAVIGSIVETGVEFIRSASGTGINMTMYTYGTNVDAVKACYTNGAWNASALNALKENVGFFEQYKDATSSEGMSNGLAQTNHIFIPQKNGSVFSPVTGSYNISTSTATLPDTSLYNTDGYYCVLGNRTWSKYKGTATFNLRSDYNVSSSVIGYVTLGEECTVMGAKDVSGNIWYHIVDAENIEGYVTGGALAIDGNIDYKTTKWTFDLYQVGSAAPLWSGTFSVNWTVDVTGTPLGISDSNGATITAITDSPNTMTFAANTFRVPTYYHTLTSNLLNGVQYTFRANNTNYVFTATEEMTSGRTLYITAGATKIYVWDIQHKKVVKEVSCASGSSTGTVLTATAYDTNSAQVTVARKIPDMDYICALDNRIWGASNSDNTIYASVQGDPSEYLYYDPGAPDAGAYSVSVSSEGAFTAIAAYGGNVLCFKEHMIHKFLGDYPSNFYMTTYTVEGVQEGCHRSLVIVNNILYYKGLYGVYAFSGYTPTLISSDLGDRKYTEACGGTDGANYFVDLKDGSGAWWLFGYNIEYGLWTVRDKVDADGFCLLDNVFYMLSNGEIYKDDSSSTEQVEWSATLCPYTEEYYYSTAYGHHKKGYTNLSIYIEMEAGSTINVEVSEDNKPFRLVCGKGVEHDLLLNIPVRLGRCMKFTVKLSGKGRCLVKSIERSFTGGSKE